MKISLDTNIWIFALLKENIFCERIVENLSQFDIIVPNQVRVELERNLPEPYLKQFYRLVKQAQIQMNYESVPQIYITMFQGKGLKKGDAIIGGFRLFQKNDYPEIVQSARPRAARSHKPARETLLGRAY